MKNIIGFVQVKGGAGRSTISTNLAGKLTKGGKAVLIDCYIKPFVDPQRLIL
jgi:MinD-like ATPase involved in chromosome partitioning or flagellar assembly